MPKKTEIPPDKVGARQKQEKSILLEQLEKTPIIQIACEKTGIARATYYRWIRDDTAFAKKCHEAILRGVSVMNDLAESQLLKAVKDGNITALIFWLKSRHSAYRDRVEVSPLSRSDELTKEEKKIVREVLSQYGVSREKRSGKKNEDRKECENENKNERKDEKKR